MTSSDTQGTIQDRATAEAVLIDLVSTPSVSGSEASAVRAFVRHAQGLGFDAHPDEAGNGIADRGNPDAPIHIVLLGHIDTVPGDIPVRVEEGILHGRGSVDAKGPLATMLVAAAQADLPEHARLTVIGAVGEEVAGSPGARHIVGRHRPHACVIGEPSGWDGVTLGYKGCLSATAIASRTNAHTAGPENSACDDAVAWWASVLAYTQRFNEGRERVFDQLQATLKHMHAATDGLDQRATLEAGFRMPVGLTPEQLARELQRLAPDSMTLACVGGETAVQSGRNDPVARHLTMAIRSAGARPKPKLKTGTADFNVVGPVWQCPIVAYGPGDSTLDHTPTEHLVLEEYHSAIGILTNALGTLARELVQEHAPS